MNPVTWWVAKEYEVDKSNNKNGQAYDLFPLQSMVYLICSSLWFAPPQQTLSSQLPSPVSSIKASEILKPCHVQLSQTWELPSIRVTRLLLVHLFSKRVLVEEQDDQNKERSFHMDNSVFNVLRLVLYFKRSRLVFLPATTVLSQHRLVLASAGERPFYKSSLTFPVNSKGKDGSRSRVSETATSFNFRKTSTLQEFFDRWTLFLLLQNIIYLTLENIKSCLIDRGFFIK